MLRGEERRPAYGAGRGCGRGDGFGWCDATVRRHFVLAAVLGLSASTRAFDAEHAELAAAVRDLAAEAEPAKPFQHRAEKNEFLVA